LNVIKVLPGRRTDIEHSASLQKREYFRALSSAISWNSKMLGYQASSRGGAVPVELRGDQ
jgi:hypothetical protein